MSRTKVAVVRTFQSHNFIKLHSSILQQVTGSNKGIGFAIVKELCSKFNGDVYLTSRDESRGIAAVEELNKLGLKSKFHQLDIDDESSVLILRDFLKTKYGGLDVLVNNAAIAVMGENDCTPEVATNTLQTNFFSTLRACKILFPILRPHARVVNLCSSVGHLSYIRGTGKAAMELKERFSAKDLTEQQLCDLAQDFVEYGDNHFSFNQLLLINLCQFGEER